jgi:hypothetical protein
MPTLSAPPAALKALLSQLVDYAGLFPPAKLSMDRAVETFARHRAGPNAWGLARFILPVSRLSEFEAAAKKYLPTVGAIDAAPPEPWGVSVLIDGNLEDNLETIERFNAQHSNNGNNGHKHAHSCQIDTLEFKVSTPDVIEDCIELLPDELFPFFEIPTDSDFRGFAAALAGTGFGAKIRTGGVTPELFPSPERVADFLITFDAAEVPFKATAGLHHPLRASYPLTYEPDCASGTMHGFLNVFMAAALIHARGIDKATALKVIEESSADAFSFSEVDARWRDLKLSTNEIAAARESFAICFGSCSFDDPINDLTKLGWL